MKTLKVKWTGIRPLIMHNADMVDPLNPFVRRIKEIHSKGSKKLTDSDREEMQRLEWEGALYWDTDLGLCLTSDILEATIKAGAQKIRLGKAMEAACFVTEPVVRIDTKTKYPKEKQALYDTKGPDGSPAYQIRKAVRVPPRTGARLMKVRPLIPTGWSVTFEIEFDESVVNGKDLLKAMTEAGALVGCCDWRPKFGRFTVEQVE